MIFHTFTLLSILVTISAQCIYSPTLCQCKQEASGNLCLGYVGLGEDETQNCQTYECGGSHRCDCTGEEMCDIRPCDGNPISYQPVNTILTAIGQTVQCVPVPKEKCVTPRAPTSCMHVDLPLINEFRPNPPGNPNPTTMTVELRGIPGYTFTGYLTSLENDDINKIGRINDVEKATGTFDDYGILLFNMTDIQNPAISVVLSSLKPGDRGDRMIVNSNGHIANREMFGEIYDAVGVPDSGPDEVLLFAENLGGTNLKFVGSQPTLVFRDSCTGEWYAVDRVEDVPTNIYDKNGVLLTTDDFNVPNVLHPTFGAANPTRRSSVLSPTMRNTGI